MDDLSVLVIAPVGRDATLIRDALAGASITARTMQSVEELAALIAHTNVGALLLTEEAVNPARIAVLVEALSQQPAWSDLPVLIFTIGGRPTLLSQQRELDRLPLGTVTLLERPIRIATLVSSVRAALRSRSRQYLVRDILRERDLAQQARLESESRLLLAVDTAHLGSWELHLRIHPGTSPATGVLQASPTCREHYDWPPYGDLSYEDLLERIHPEDRSAVERKIAAASSSSGVFTADHRVTWQDGRTRWISISGRRLQDSGSSRAFNHGTSAEGSLRLTGVSLDITERVLSELALRNAEKLAIVGRLASSIAHEINNPLEAVTNLLYLLKLSPLGPAEDQYVTMAQQELARVSEITAQTLAFGRQQNNDQEAVFAELLDSVLALYRGRMATSNIQVERAYRYKQPVLCRPSEVRQVFTNLIGNAFDATRQGGRIVVRERLAVHPRSGHAGIRVTIADTGSGIPRELQRRVFEAFISTKGNNGTGLGLWISKGIVEKHGGTLRFRSSPEGPRRGSVFSLFLPLPER